MDFKLLAPALAFAGVALASCGGGTDLSVGQQDITFTVALSSQPALAQGGSSTATAEVRDDDDTGGEPSPAEREPFNSRVDLRFVGPLPPGVAASFSRNPVAPGEVASVIVTADADALPGRYQLVVAGTISGGSTTRYFPHVVTIAGNCAPRTPPIGDIYAGERTIFVARTGETWIAGFNTRRDESHPATPIAPKALELYTPVRVPELSPVRSATTQPLSQLSAFVTDTGGLRVMSRYYLSGVGAPRGVPGWYVESVPGASGFLQVVSTRQAFFALHRDGTVWTFTPTLREEDGVLLLADPVPVQGLVSIVQLAAGFEHVLARNGDGRVFAFGLNTSGQLGDDTGDSRQTPAPVIGIDNVTAIAAGSRHSVALRADGTVWAWGNNSAGQLGDRTTTGRRLPVQAVRLDGVALDQVAGIAAGASHVLALRRDFSLWSWGDGVRGQHGDGARQSRPAASSVDLLSLGLAAGANNSFALALDGTVDAWGENDAGTLADGTREERARPVRLLGVGRGEGGPDCRATEPPPPAAVVFEDLQFGATSWEAIVVSPPVAGVSASAQQAAGGGNPGAVRRMTHAMRAAPGIEMLLRVVHLNLGATYDPARSGAIDRLDYREDRIVFASETARQGASGTVALRQGERLFIAVLGDGDRTFFSGITWSTQGWSDLRRADFGQVAGPECPTSVACPDFSASGAPITFGYWRETIGGTNDPRVDIEHGIDNWRVTVFPARP